MKKQKVKNDSEVPRKKSNIGTKIIVWLMVLTMAATSIFSGLAMFF